MAHHYLAWTGTTLPERLEGPWTEYRRVADDLALLESDQPLSPVYHELKWSLPDGTALLVAPLHARPKLKGLAAGTTTWLRDRLPDQPEDEPAQRY